MNQFNIHDFSTQNQKYIHGKCRGFTVVLGKVLYVNTVCVQVAYCSKKDNYNRKKGVQVAKTKPVAVIPMKELPKYLKNVFNKAYNQYEDNDWGPDYNWVVTKLLD